MKLELFSCKNKNFIGKLLISCIFLIFAQNIDCGYKGVYITRTCFIDGRSGGAQGGGVLSFFVDT